MVKNMGQLRHFVVLLLIYYYFLHKKLLMDDTIGLWPGEHYYSSSEEVTKWKTGYSKDYIRQIHHTIIIQAWHAPVTLTSINNIIIIPCRDHPSGHWMHGRRSKSIERADSKSTGNNEEKKMTMKTGSSSSSSSSKNCSKHY